MFLTLPVHMTLNQQVLREKQEVVDLISFSKYDEIE